ncbi:3-methyl-2-oxobutanoate hydroxymethyltransferase [Flavobacteriaceae bacterium UJ101]|nr:3-methyl-2-oxobutanoate hydroxymethyltransferase [Flavobacteriaceae bacterium UJ101]
MSSGILGSKGKITIKKLQKLKNEGEKISMLTAYDFTTAQILDRAGIDVILVGDSASNVFAGNESTLPITLDEMIYHAKAVTRAVHTAFVVVDIPFGYYQSSPEKALESAIRIMKETTANAVKLEGGREIEESIVKILNAGIPVMGHLGLTPQSFNQFGGYSVQAKTTDEAQLLTENAEFLQKIGCFSVVLEKIPSTLATQVSQKLSIPTIGIGAGNGTDGQVLVVNDMLGLTDGFNPKFLRKYLNLHEEITGAVQDYIQDVKSTDFPNETEQY